MAKNFFIALFFFLFGVFPMVASAADLSIVPSSGTYDVGDLVVVKVQVKSDTPPNAVSTELSLNPSILSIDSVSKAGSILNFWVTEPTFSKSNGTVKFEGVALNGFHGGTGNVATITFHATKAGSGRIVFKTGQVLANDGEGTDITGNLNGATFNFVVRDVPVKKEPIKVIEEIPQPLPTLKPPEIMESAKYGEQAIVGTSQYPNSDALLTFVSATGVKVFILGKSDETGSFALLVPKSLKRGMYSVSAVMIKADQVHSSPSNEIIISVGHWFSDLSWGVISAFILLWIVLLYLLIRVYIHLRQDRIRRIELNKHIKETEKMINKSFNILREDLSGHGHARSNTGEKHAIEDIKKDIDDAEDALSEKVKDL